MAMCFFERKEISMEMSIHVSEKVGEWLVGFRRSSHAMAEMRFSGLRADEIARCVPAGELPADLIDWDDLDMDDRILNASGNEMGSMWHGVSFDKDPTWEELASLRKDFFERKEIADQEVHRKLRERFEFFWGWIQTKEGSDAELLRRRQAEGH